MQRLLTVPYIFLLILSLLSASCATVQLKKPLIDVLDIQPRTGQGLKFGFDIVLKITNPNAIALPVSGMSYSAKINNASVIHGVSNAVPTIPAYGSAVVTVSSDISLLSAPRLLLELADSKNKNLSYSLTADIDLKGLLPGFSIQTSGQLSTQ